MQNRAKNLLGLIILLGLGSSSLSSAGLPAWPGATLSVSQQNRNAPQVAGLQPGWRPGWNIPKPKGLYTPPAPDFFGMGGPFESGMEPDDFLTGSTNGNTGIDCLDCTGIVNGFSFRRTFAGRIGGPSSGPQGVGFLPPIGGIGSGPIGPLASLSGPSGPTGPVTRTSAPLVQQIQPENPVINPPGGGTTGQNGDRVAVSEPSSLLMIALGLIRLTAAGRGWHRYSPPARQQA